MFAPTKTWRRWHRRVNVNQKRYAICSALAASALPALVMAKGKLTPLCPELHNPLIYCKLGSPWGPYNDSACMHCIYYVGCHLLAFCFQFSARETSVCRRAEPNYWSFFPFEG